MSPEQIEKSRDIDPRTDIYSLGAVLYEALTLETMIAGESFQEICDNARHVPPLPPSRRAPDRVIPADLAEICMKAVEKDPADRFPTARKLVAELQAWRARRVRRSG
jgi:serine/threonine protein kinase